MADLLPCPFCGGESRIVYGVTKNAAWDGGEFSRVYCGECQVRHLYYQTDEEAIAAWNTRSRLLGGCGRGKPAGLPSDPKPRLFYYEEAVNAWVPWTDGYDFASILEMLDDGEDTQLEFRRIDMTDEEFDNLPEVS